MNDGDHFYGLMGLLSTIGNSSRVDDLTIVGPKGICEIIDAMKTLIEYLPYKIIVVENPNGTFSLVNDILKDIEIFIIYKQRREKSIWHWHIASTT